MDACLWLIAGIFASGAVVFGVGLYLEIRDEMAEEEDEATDEEWSAEDEEYFRSGTRYPGQ